MAGAKGQQRRNRATRTTERKREQMERQMQLRTAKTAPIRPARQDEGTLKKIVPSFREMTAEELPSDTGHDEAVARALQLQLYNGHGNNILLYVDSLESTLNYPQDPRTDSAKKMLQGATESKDTHEEESEEEDEDEQNETEDDDNDYYYHYYYEYKDEDVEEK